MRLTWLIHTIDMTHSYWRHWAPTCFWAWHDAFMRQTWWWLYKIHAYGRRDSFLCEKGLMHMGDMTHSYARQDSFICETWLIHTRGMTHSYKEHDSTFLYRTPLWHLCHVTWLMHTRNTTHRMSNLLFHTSPTRVYPAALALMESSEAVLAMPRSVAFLYPSPIPTCCASNSFAFCAALTTACTAQ